MYLGINQNNCSLFLTNFIDMLCTISNDNLIKIYGMLYIPIFYKFYFV